MSEAKVTKDEISSSDKEEKKSQKKTEARSMFDETNLLERLPPLYPDNQGKLGAELSEAEVSFVENRFLPDLVEIWKEQLQRKKQLILQYKNTVEQQAALQRKVYDDKSSGVELPQNVRLIARSLYKAHQNAVESLNQTLARYDFQKRTSPCISFFVYDACWVVSISGSLPDNVKVDSGAPDVNAFLPCLEETCKKYGMTCIKSCNPLNYKNIRKICSEVNMFAQVRKCNIEAIQNGRISSFEICFNPQVGWAFKRKYPCDECVQKKHQYRSEGHRCVSQGDLLAHGSFEETIETRRGFCSNPSCRVVAPIEQDSDFFAKFCFFKHKQPAKKGGEDESNSNNSLESQNGWCILL